MRESRPRFTPRRLRGSQLPNVNIPSASGSIGLASLWSRWQKLVRFLGLFSLCCFLAVSCGGPAADSPNTGGDPNRIVIGTTAKIRTIDPADSYEVQSGTLLYNMGDRLYTYESGTLNLTPQLAKELPAISADGITYTMPLRQGVVFHDGTPFNAEAMVFSLRRFMENGGNPSSLLANIVESVEAIGEYELKITLKQPFAAFTSLLTFPGICAVSPAAYEIGEGKFLSDRFVGTGPYKLANYGTDSIKLEVFEDYWGSPPANKGIDLQRFSSPVNLFNAFRTGAVDVTFGSLGLEQVASLEREAKSNKWQMVSRGSAGINILSLNLRDPALSNPDVREALAAIVDRNLLESRVFRGQMEPLYSLIPITLAEFYQPVFKTEYGDGNTAKAKEALARAGYSTANPLKLELWYRSNATNDGLVATTIKASVEKELAGAMLVELNSVEAATAYNNLDKGVYPLFILDWSPDFLDPDNYIQPFLDCEKGSEEKGCESGESQLWGSFYYSDRVNQLIEQQRQERDPQKRQEIFLELQNILARDIPFIPLWQGKEYIFSQNNIQGATLEPSQRFPFWPISKN